MDPPQGPLSRTMWSIWNYIVEAVERFLRPDVIVVGATDGSEPASAESLDHACEALGVRAEGPEEIGGSESLDHACEALGVRAEGPEEIGGSESLDHACEACDVRAEGPEEMGGSESLDHACEALGVRAEGPEEIGGSESRPAGVSSVTAARSAVGGQGGEGAQRERSSLLHDCFEEVGVEGEIENRTDSKDSVCLPTTATRNEEKERTRDEVQGGIGEEAGDEETGEVMETGGDKETGGVMETGGDKETGGVMETGRVMETGGVMKTGGDMETGATGSRDKLDMTYLGSVFKDMDGVNVEDEVDGDELRKNSGIERREQPAKNVSVRDEEDILGGVEGLSEISKQTDTRGDTARFYEPRLVGEEFPSEGGELWTSPSVSHAELDDNGGFVSGDEITVVTQGQMMEGKTTDRRKMSVEEQTTERVSDEDRRGVAEEGGVKTSLREEEDSEVGGTEHRAAMFVGVSREKTTYPRRDEVHKDEIPGLRTSCTSCDQKQNVDMEKPIVGEDEVSSEKEESVRGMEGGFTSTAVDEVMENNGVSSLETYQGPSVSPEPEREACEKKTEEIPEHNNGQELDEDTAQKILEVWSDDEMGTAHLREVNTRICCYVAQREDGVGGRYEAQGPLVRDWEVGRDGEQNPALALASHGERLTGVITEGQTETQSHSDTESPKDTEKSGAVPVNKTVIQEPKDLSVASVELSEEDGPRTEADLLKEREGKLEAECGAGETVQGKVGIEGRVVTRVWTPTRSPVETETSSPEREQEVDTSVENKTELHWVAKAVSSGDAMETGPQEEVVGGTIRLKAESDEGLPTEPETEVSEVRTETVLAAVTGAEKVVHSEAEEVEETEERDDGLSDKPSGNETKQSRMEAGKWCDSMGAEFRLPGEMVVLLVPEKTVAGEPEGSLAGEARKVEGSWLDEMEVEAPDLRTEAVNSEDEVEAGPGSPAEMDDGSGRDLEETEAESTKELVRARCGYLRDARVRGEVMLVDTQTGEAGDKVAMEARLTSETNTVLSGQSETEAPSEEPGRPMEPGPTEEDEALEASNAESGLIKESSEELIENLMDSGLPDEFGDALAGLTEEFGDALAGLTEKTETDSADELLEAGIKITAVSLSEESVETETEISDVSRDTELASCDPVNTQLRGLEDLRQTQEELLSEIKAESTDHLVERENGSHETLEDRVVESLEGHVRSSTRVCEGQVTGDVMEVENEEGISEEDGKPGPSSGDGSAYHGLQLQSGASILDFTAQKSRICIKSPHVRPPRNPRSLLLMPSLEPCPPQPSPRALARTLAGGPMAGMGGIGIKLPGLGGGFPVLRTTKAGVTRDDSEIASQKPKAEPEEAEESHKQDEVKPKPKWTPPRQPGFGNPLMMSELRNKLKKAQD